MRILVIGGTIFLGRHIVQSAVLQGHEVTIFHRGKHNPHLFPTVRKIKGDRKKDLSQLDEKWDTLIDTCGYFPKDVRITASLMADRIKNYVFVSTLSIYRDFQKEKISETYPAKKISNPDVKKIDGHTYGPLKYLCEEEIKRFFPSRALIIRPGLIVGPYDPSHRFTYWPFRLDRGGNMVVPGSPQYPLQYIDVRDLAKWIIRMIEIKTSGVFNAVGPENTFTMGNLITIGQKSLNRNVHPVWVKDSILLENEIVPWTDFPLWIPHSEEMKGFHRIDNSKAIENGLIFTDPEKTMQDTLEWFKQGFSASVFTKQLKIEKKVLSLLDKLD